MIPEATGKVNSSGVPVKPSTNGSKSVPAGAWGRLGDGVPGGLNLDS